MLESSSALVKANEKGGDLVSPIGGERVEKDLGYLQILPYPFSPDLRVLPCGFPVPKGEGLGSRKRGEG